MYHLEMRHFPHNAWRFNLTEAQVAALVVPWIQQEWIDVGERKWNPHEATMTVLEGPELALNQLKMGRGWRTAQRESTDVTERVMDAARASLQAQQEVAAEPAADALTAGVRLASLLGPDAERLLEAWRAEAVAAPGQRPSESLTKAEAKLAGTDPAAG